MNSKILNTILALAATSKAASLEGVAAAELQNKLAQKGGTIAE